MKIIDDFIKPTLQDKLVRLCEANDFPYFFSADTVDAGYRDIGWFDDENTIHTPQFVHSLVECGRINSPFFNEFAPVFHKLYDLMEGDFELVRYKVNLNPRDGRFVDKYHVPHIDNQIEGAVTAVYYINDADGDTIFFDDERRVVSRVAPKKGRLIYWSGKRFHAKTSPVNCSSRFVLNLNLSPLG
jgi:hypothetical protein